MMSASLARADGWVAKNFSLSQTDTVYVATTDDSTPTCRKNHEDRENFVRDELLANGAIVTEEPMLGLYDYWFNTHMVVFKTANKCVGVITLSLRKRTLNLITEGKHVYHISYAAKHTFVLNDNAEFEAELRHEIKGFITDMKSPYDPPSDKYEFYHTINPSK